MAESTQARQAEFDAVRAIGALLVIAVHYLATFYPFVVFGPANGYIQRASWESILVLPVWGALIAGHAAVCMFFVLSGYVLSYSSVGRKVTLVSMLVACCKRPVRLGGVVLFTGLAGGLLWSSNLFFNVQAEAMMAPNPWLLMYWPGELSPSFPFDFLWAPFATGVVYNPPLWTIHYELYGSLLIFALLAVASGWRWRWLVWLIALILLQGSLYQGFIFGVIAADLAKNGPALPSRAKRGLSIGSLLLAVFFVSRPAFFHPDDLQSGLFGWLPELEFLGGSYSMLGALLLFVALYCSPGARRFFSGSQTIQYFGKISYALYALHFLVLGSVSCWLYVEWEADLGHPSASLVASLTGTLLLLPLAHLLTVTVDRISIILSDDLGRYLRVHFTRFRERLLGSESCRYLVSALRRLLRPKLS